MGKKLYDNDEIKEKQIFIFQDPFGVQGQYLEKILFLMSLS